MTGTHAPRRRYREGRSADIDPVDFSVFLSNLNGVAVEMTLTLENAAMTPILALCRDYSCCVYDAQSRQVAMVDAIPIHTNSMHLILSEITRYFGDDIYEGDVIACNDAHHRNTHIGDLVTVCPVFHEGQHMFWAAAKGHQLDVGAPVPSSVNSWARDVWQEGLTIPPLKLYERGTPRHDVIELYLANVRWRELLAGDLMAQLGAIWTGERGLQKLCARFGQTVTTRYVEEAIAYASERTAAEIREMPNGVYVGEGWLDSDGIGEQFDIPVRCKVEIEDEEVLVDFTGSAPAVAGATNASYAVMQAAGGIPLIMALDPDIMHNEGCLSRVSVTAPLGSICNAEFPRATASATVIPADLLQDVVWKALAHAIPERVRAGTAHWGTIPMLSGGGGGSSAAWGHLFLNCGGGGGATLDADGWPLITTSAAEGGLKTASVEHTELLYPLVFEEWELEPDSMGLGRCIGGPGIRCTIRPLEAPIDMLVVSDSLTNPPHGVAGGTAGAGGGSFVTADDGRRRFLPPTYSYRLAPAERWTGVATGGGGYGDPLERSLEAVRRDVRDGVIGIETARTVFGVLLSADRDPVLDEAATATARASLLAARSGAPLPLITPTYPHASLWLERTREPADEYLTELHP